MKGHNKLIDHAKRELDFIGIDKDDADYDGLIAQSVLDLVTLFAKQGHSGASAELTASLFYRLIQFRPLGPLTNEPSEWEEVTGSIYTDEDIKLGKRIWQNLRSPSTFSYDGGKTWEDLQTKSKGTSLTMEEALNVISGQDEGLQTKAGEGASSDGAKGAGGLQEQPATEPSESKASGGREEQEDVAGSKPPVASSERPDPADKSQRGKEASQGREKGKKGRAQGGKA